MDIALPQVLTRLSDGRWLLYSIGKLNPNPAKSQSSVLLYLNLNVTLTLSVM